MSEEKNPATNKHTIELTPEQKQAIELVKERRNVFITGEAGTGKSTLIARLVETLKEKKLRCAVVAMTGLAATLIRGCTLHGFLGLGLMH